MPSNWHYFSNCPKINGFFAENAQKSNIFLTYFLDFVKAANHMAYGATLHAFSTNYA